jgi:hypothetical protein
MSKTPLNLTRNQLQQMAPNQRALKALEAILTQTNEQIPSDIDAIAYDAASGAANANEALSQLITLTDDATALASEADAKGANALSQLAKLTDDAIELATEADSKGARALGELKRIADSLEILAMSPGPSENNNSHQDYTSFRRGSNAAYKEGRLFYDWNDHSLSYYNDASDVTLNIGREHLIRVLNNSGSTMTSGQVVYISGSSGGWPTVLLAKADNATSYLGTIGVVTSTIANGAYGYVTTEGIVNGIDTSSFSAGASLYLSATVSGGLVAAKPAEPNYTVFIGYVANVNATTGSLIVHIDREPWYPVAEILNTSATVTLPTTPTIFAATTVNKAYGTSYDTGTGILTFSQNGSYAFAIEFNAEPSASNKSIYFYVEEDTGSGWVISRYSARKIDLANASQTQVTISAAKYYPAGTKIRFYIWGDATITLKTTDVTGTTPGTVTVPAFRMLVA